jgi:hypothetical protein
MRFSIHCKPFENFFLEAPSKSFEDIPLFIFFVNINSQKVSISFSVTEIRGDASFREQAGQLRKI